MFFKTPSLCNITFLIKSFFQQFNFHVRAVLYPILSSRDDQLPAFFKLN